MEALLQGITQQQNLLGTLIVVLHTVAHIVLYIKIIQSVEALLQGITQQHILVACQTLQITLKVLFQKAITLQKKKVTTLQKHLQDLPPCIKLERLESRLTPLQKRRLKTLREKGKTTEGSYTPPPQISLIRDYLKQILQ